MFYFINFERKNLFRLYGLHFEFVFARYVRLVEAGIHEALSLGWGEGRGWRAPRPARPPPHLHAALASLAPPSRGHLHAARTALTPLLNEHYKVKYNTLKKYRFKP